MSLRSVAPLKFMLRNELASALDTLSCLLGWVASALAYLALAALAVDSVPSLSNVAPLVGPAAALGAPFLGFFDSSTALYELSALLEASQGLLGNGGLGGGALFNPGADIDFTTTTDFEDLAAPAADVMEFTDQDRALVADSILGVIF